MRVRVRARARVRVRVRLGLGLGLGLADPNPNPNPKQALVAAFAERRVWKCYIGVCAGVPPARSMVDAPI